MNEKYMIVLFFAMIIIGIVIYITTSNKKKKKKDSGGGEPKTPTFEVMRVQLSKTESYKPWFTERYTPDDFIAMSEGTSFKYSMKITGGAEVLTALSITRKRADQGEDQTVAVPSEKWKNNEGIELTFQSLEGENVKGTHNFSINYTTPEKSGTGTPVEIAVSESDLSVGLEQSGGELDLVLQSMGMDIPSAEATTNKKYVFIYDHEGQLNFGKGEEIYMSPFGNDGKAFKLEGTGITDPLYRIKHKEGADGANLYLLSKSSTANYDNTEYLDKTATFKTYKQGPLQEKLFYITMDEITSEVAKNFFFDVDFSIPTGKWLSCGGESDRDCCHKTFAGEWEQVFEERDGEVGNKCFQDEEGVWKFKYNRTGIEGCNESNEKFEYNDSCCADYFLGEWTPGPCDNGKRKLTRRGNEGCQSINEDRIDDDACCAENLLGSWTPGQCENGKRIWTRPGLEGCQSTNEDPQDDDTCPEYPFTSFTFTNAGATGRFGPTLDQCKDSYSPSWVNNPSYFSVSDGIQKWTVPATGTYEIEIAGAKGGGEKGYGAVQVLDLNLTKSEKLNICVGQRGSSDDSSRGGGGGGGSFLVKSDVPTNNEAQKRAALLCASGGGGGNSCTGRFRVEWTEHLASDKKIPYGWNDCPPLSTASEDCKKRTLELCNPDFGNATFQDPAGAGDDLRGGHRGSAEDSPYKKKTTWSGEGGKDGYGGKIGEKLDYFPPHEPVVHRTNGAHASGQGGAGFLGNGQSEDPERTRDVYGNDFGFAAAQSFYNGCVGGSHGGAASCGGEVGFGGFGGGGSAYRPRCASTGHGYYHSGGGGGYSGGGGGHPNNHRGDVGGGGGSSYSSLGATQNTSLNSGDHGYVKITLK